MLEAYGSGLDTFERFRRRGDPLLQIPDEEVHRCLTLAFQRHCGDPANGWTQRKNKLICAL